MNAAWCIPLSITVAITLANDVFKADFKGKVAPKATRVFDLFYFLTKTGFFRISPRFEFELSFNLTFLADPSLSLVDPLEKADLAKVGVELPEDIGPSLDYLRTNLNESEDPYT